MNNLSPSDRDHDPAAALPTSSAAEGHLGWSPCEAARVRLDSDRQHDRRLLDP